ncbi:MAG: hypothetical protein HY033_02495 [Ignavibacteriae bacterium]|nr:hypothetical protein [Ignavibacteria bacterium]MBI3363756.1 hypothetical protein [Ignavibacteriota bacterium]
MERRITQVTVVVIMIGGICWLGGINIRAMIGFDLLEPGTLDFKANIHPYVERAVYSLIAQSSMVINSAYLIVWVAGVLFLRTSSFRLKEHGWLLMVAILFYLFTPVEIYAMVLDAKMWYLDNIGSNDLVEFRKIFIHRLAALAGVPMIALLSYYTAIVVAIFRPFEKRNSATSTR